MAVGDTELCGQFTSCVLKTVCRLNVPFSCCTVDVLGPCHHQVKNTGVERVTAKAFVNVNVEGCSDLIAKYVWESYLRPVCIVGGLACFLQVWSSNY